MDDAARLAPTLHGLALDPPTLRPGTTTRVTLTLRNRSALLAPPLRIRFMLPPELHALDAAIAEVESLAPGVERTVICRARVRDDVRDGSELHVQAAVAYAGREVGTNVAVARVAAEPLLGGAGTSFSLADLGNGTVGLDVCVRNEGDGAADDVVVAIPPQPGFAQSGHVTLTLGSIPAGEERRTHTVLDVARAGGDGRLAIDGVVLRDSCGRRTPLAQRALLTLAPRLAQPALEIDDDGDRVTGRLLLAAAGPVHVEDVEVDVQLPAGFRLAPASLRYDGAPITASPRNRGRRIATMRSAGNEATVSVARLAAGTTATLTFDAHRAGVAGRISACVRGAGRTYTIYADVAAVPPVPPRMTVIAPPPPLTVNGRGIAIVEFAALGTRSVTARLQLDGAQLMSVDGRRTSDVALAPAEIRDVALELICTSPLTREAVLICRSDDAETAVTFPILVRADETEADGRETTAAPATPRVDVMLGVPHAATAGAPIDCTLRLNVQRAAARVDVGFAPQPNLEYVAGSTRVDDHAVLDGEQPALARGLSLRDLPAGTVTTISWRCLVAADADGTIAPLVRVDVDGVSCVVPETTIEVQAPDIFASRPAGLTFHIEAPLAPSGALTVPPPATLARTEIASVYVPQPEVRHAEVEAQPAVPFPIAPQEPPHEPAQGFEPLAPAGGWTTMWAPIADDEPPVAAPRPAPAMPRTPLLAARYDGPHAAAALRLLDGGEMDGLVTHVLALRVLVPTSVAPPDSAVEAALEELHAAVRDVLDRLFVKIRIPAYDLSGFDCEDGASRAALGGLVARLADAGYDVGSWRATLDAVPIGDAAALAVIAELPQDDGGPGAQRAHSYAAAIADLLRRYAALDAAAFDTALARGAEASLVVARAAFTDELRAIAGEVVR